MKKAKKAIGMIVMLAMLASTLSGLSFVAFAANLPIDNQIEAEAGTLGAVTKVKDAGSSGGTYITIAEGERVDDATKLPKPDAAFTFDIPADGTYQVWMKVKILTGGQDSYHWKWDNDAYATVHPGEKGENYVWLKAAEAPLKAGAHTFYWTHREIGTWFDAIFVTTDEKKLPPLTGGTSTPTSASPAPTKSEAPTTGVGINANAKKFNTVDGSVMFEAEDATIDKTNIATIADKEASGGKAVQMSKDDRNLPPASATGGLEFNVAIDKKGTYNVWIRLVSTGGGSDSSWCSVNGGAYKDTQLPGNSADEKDYKWAKYASLGTLDVGATGNLRIITRETGAKIDKFIITCASGFTPSGMGSIPTPGEINIAKLDETAYPKPTITPPAEHPRLLFKKSDLPTIKATMEAPEAALAVTAYNKLLTDSSDGNLPSPTRAGSNNYNGAILGAIEAKAFEYALNGDETLGKLAVTAIKNYIATCTYDGMADNTRAMGHVIFTAAEVYDWCYPLLTDQDKKIIVSGCENIASGMEIGWPPKGQGAVSGHGGEAQLMRDLLSLGIATYDDFPDIYNYVAGRYFSQFLETRNYWFTSNTQHQGDAYGPYRYLWDLWGQWIIKRMSGNTVFIPDSSKVSYQWIYTRRPDGQLLREGDCFSEGAAKGTYWNTLATTLFYASNFYKDPYLKKEMFKENPALGTFTYNNTTLTPTQIFIFDDPTIGVKPVSELPRTKYFASPVGQMVARTGWNSGFNAPDAVAFMKIGEQWAANHNHLDVGNFQIYYKGILASESGFYESYNTNHDKNYNKESIAHNTMLIYDPNENTNGGVVNAGGQRRPGGEVSTMADWMKDDNYKMAKVIGQEFGPDPMTPEYTYLAGDITKAYTDKVKEALRSMIFLPLEDTDHPAAFVVMDKVTSSNPAFKKTFLLHSQQEPQINGNVSIIKRDTDGYNGMLTTQTLLPKDAKIEKIGGEGKEFMINGTNYALQKPVSATSSIEAGWGRLEISPASSNATDYFLNVMYVNDADKTLPLEKAALIENDAVVGAKIFNRVAVFSKNVTRMEKEVSFTVEGTDSDLKVAVAGLKEGTWSVSVNGSDLGNQIATKDGGIVYFTAAAGSYKLTYADATATRPVIQPVIPTSDGIDIKITNNYLYTDVPPAIINDRTLVPMRAIFEALKAKVEWDDATKTAIATKDATVIKITEDSKTAYINGEAKELDVPATIINGRFLVPVRFVSEAMGAKVAWDDFSQTVIITPNMGSTSGGTASGALGPNKDGVAQIVGSNCSSFFELTTPDKSYDGDPVSLWSAEGDGQWVSYEFKEPMTIVSVYVLLNKATERQGYFDIQSSDDGKEYKTVLSCIGDGKSDGELFKFKEPVKAKYFRYYGKGNSASMWNAVKEIEFRTK